MKWKFIDANEIPSNGEKVFCVFNGSCVVREILFEEFYKHQVKAWVRSKDIYYDFLDKAILDNGVEIMPTK